MGVKQKKKNQNMCTLSPLPPPSVCHVLASVVLACVVVPLLSSRRCVSCWRLLLLFMLLLCVVQGSPFAGGIRVGLAWVGSAQQVLRKILKKKCYSAIPQRPPWLWQLPYETRNVTAIWWRFFKNP